jgi:hypothetical protein
VNGCSIGKALLFHNILRKINDEKKIEIRSLFKAIEEFRI